MNISVAVLVCKVLSSGPEVCHEEIVYQGDLSMGACMIASRELADWKSKTIYADESWRIARWKCVPGDYVIKDRI